MFHTENELRDKPTTPSKEEIETNEKNLASSEGSAGKLGQLVFKLRLDDPCNPQFVAACLNVSLIMID
jgi:hypothetical protein